MKMSRRVLAIMLTVFMLVGLMPIGAFAEGGAEKEAAAEEQVPVPNEEEIKEEQPEGKTKEVPEEQPKEQPEEIPEEEPEEQTEEIPNEELEEQPEEIPDEELKEQPEEIPEEEPEEQLEEIPKEQPEENPEEQPEENPEEQPEELPEEFPPEFPMGLSLAPKGFAEANFNASSEAANAGAGEHDFYEIETQLIYKGKVANNLGEIILSSSSNGVIKKGDRLYGAKNDVYLIPTIDWKVPGYRVVGTVHFAHSDGTVGGGGLNIGKTFRFSEGRGYHSGKYTFTAYVDDDAPVYDIIFTPDTELGSFNCYQMVNYPLSIEIKKQAEGKPVMVRPIPASGAKTVNAEVIGKTTGRYYEVWPRANGGEIEFFEFDMPAEDVRVNVYFAQESQLNRIYKGTTSDVDYDISHTYAKTGDLIKLKEIPNDDYRITGWSYALGSQDGPKTDIALTASGEGQFIMPDGPIWVAPQYEIAGTSYNVYGSSTSTVTVRPSVGKAHEGRIIVASVTLKNGYGLKRLYYEKDGDPGTRVDIPIQDGVLDYSFAMPNYDIVLNAETVAPYYLEPRLFINNLLFENSGQLEYTLTSSNNKVWDYGQGHLVGEGGKVTLQVTDNEMYSFKEAYIIESGTGFKKPIKNDVEFTMSGTEFQEGKSYALVINVENKAGTRSIFKGNSDHCTLKIMDSGKNEISMQKVGGWVDVMVTPNDGWEVVRLVVSGRDGLAIDAWRSGIDSNIFSFTMPDYDCVVIARCVRKSTGQEKEYNLTFDYDRSQGASLVREANNKTKARAGDLVTVFAFPQEGWLLEKLTITDTANKKELVPELTGRCFDNGTFAEFIMPEGDVTVSATYKINTESGYHTVSVKIDGYGTVGLRTANDAINYIEGRDTTLTLTVKEGNVYSLTIKPDMGATYDVEVISQAQSVSNVTEGRNQIRYFQMREWDQSFKVTFTKLQYGEIIKKDCENGRVEVFYKQAPPGFFINIAAMPDKGYYTEGVYARAGNDLLEIVGTGFSMPANNVEVWAKFKKIEEGEKPWIYSNGALPAGVVGKDYSFQIAKGCTSAIIVGGNLPKGLYLTSNGMLYGYPESPGTYVFTAEFKNDNGGNTLGYEIKISNKECAVDLITKPAEAGIISIDTEYDTNITGDGKYLAGSNTYLTAKPNLGYIFEGWYFNDTLVSQNEYIEHRVDDDIKIEARFKDYRGDHLYTVDVSSEDESKGTVTLKMDGKEVTSPQEMGENSIFIAEAIPKDGYFFKGWKEDTSLPNPYQVNGVNGQYHLTATFDVGVLTDLQIINPPSKTEYLVGETFDPEGMVVRAFYGDENYGDVTNYTISPESKLTLADKEVTVSYTLNGVKKTAKQNITVSRSPDSIKIDDTNLKDLKYEDGPIALTLSDEGKGTGAVTWTSSNSSVLSIDGTTATILKPGQVTITATKAGDDTYEKTVDTLEVTIGKKVLSVDISLEFIDYGQTLAATNLKATDSRVSCSWDDPSIVPKVRSSDTYTGKFSLLEQWKDYYSLNKDTFVTSVIVMPVKPHVEVTATKTSDTTAMLRVTIRSVGKGLAPRGYVELWYNADGGAYNKIDKIALKVSDDGSYSYVEKEWTIPGVGTEYNIGAFYDNEGEGNYRASKANAINFDPRKINQEEVVVTASSDAPVYGEALSFTARGGSGSGLVTYESSDPQTVSVDKETGVATILKSGQVIITATKAEDLTYNEAKGTLSIIVKKAALTFKADDKEMLQQDPMPSLTYTMSGLVEGDTLAEAPSLTTVADGKTVGDYDILISGGAVKTKSGAAWTDCYDVTYEKATLTVKKLYVYNNVEGGNGTWTKGSNEPLRFIFKRTENDAETFDHFTGVSVDGKPLPEKDSSGRVNYTARSGSVIIELQPEYLESLALGQHRITVGFDDGKDASASFTIQKEQENKAANKDNKKNNSSGRSAASGTANDSPRTGDENRLGMWLILFLLAGSVMLLNSNYFLRSKK